MKPVELPSLDAIRAAQERISSLAWRTPLVPLQHEEAPGSVQLKLENLQPVGSFKIRGAAHALCRLPRAELRDGVSTASAGNMGRAVAYVARLLGVACRVIVPQHAPETKLRGIEREGAEIVRVPFDRWWTLLLDPRGDEIRGRFVHPVCDTDVIAGHATIGLEIAEALPELDAVIVPFGGGGLGCGIATALRALGRDCRVYASEIETAAPLAASLAAGQPVEVPYTPSLVDGIGGKSLLPGMWELARELLAGSIVVGLRETAEAVRALAERHRVIAEGAAGTALAAALTGHAGAGTTVCVVSGGNIDAAKLSAILEGRVP